MITEFKNCVVGALVRVNDFDLIAEYHTKNIQPPLDFLIEEKRVFDNGDDDLRIILKLNHVGTDEIKLLILTAFKDNYDVKLYYKPEFFNPAKISIRVISFASSRRLPGQS